ncbi:MAG: hypothetical protein R3C97_01500 [Geminicoccaceae bacterium]
MLDLMVAEMSGTAVFKDDGTVEFTDSDGVSSRYREIRAIRILLERSACHGSAGRRRQTDLLHAAGRHGGTLRNDLETAMISLDLPVSSKNFGNAWQSWSSWRSCRSKTIRELRSRREDR